MVKKREIKKIAKKVLGKNEYKNIKKIEDKKNQLQLFIYLIYSYLEKKYLELETKISQFKNEEVDVFFAESKLIIIPHKIRIFKLMPSKKEFNKVNEWFNIVEKELENV
jgi:hypothetical protein